MVQFFPQIGSIALTLVLWLSAASSVLAQGPCNNQTSVTYEGYTYEIVEIDGRCWFAENLRYLPSVSPSTQSSQTDALSYVYGYEGITVADAMETENYINYGVLYNKSSQSVCPIGWSLPTVTIWESLIDLAGGANFSSSVLSSSPDDNPPWFGTNDFGFSAVPGGYFTGYDFNDLEYATKFLLATYPWGGSQNDVMAYASVSLGGSSIHTSSVGGSNNACAFGMSVRCILGVSGGCTNTEACNYDPFASFDNESCLTFDECGVCGGNGIMNGACDCEGNTTDALGDCGGACEADIDGDGICDDQDSCVGAFDDCEICNGDNTTCMDECGVPNGPGAIYECGCADIPEGECDCEGTVLVMGYDCYGNCLNDADGDGVCDEFEVLGCTDITACNYEDDATEENGSCILQGDFCNDGNFLTIDDFVQADCSCNGFGCNNPSACNYSETALHQPELCDFESCQGCLDEAACNYSSNSIIDDGSCYYVGDSCDDGDEASFNDSVQSDCSCEGDYIGGCTYWIACNYDPDAVIDDGSCTFIGELCDDLNPLTFNDIVDENCFCGDIAITNVGEWTFSGFKVYPNPSNGMVWVEAGGAGSRFDVNVYDSASRIVASKTGIDRLNLDVSNCAPGLYLIEVNVDGSMHRTQLILQ